MKQRKRRNLTIGLLVMSARIVMEDATFLRSLPGMVDEAFSFNLAIILYYKILYIGSAFFTPTTRSTTDGMLVTHQAEFEGKNSLSALSWVITFGITPFLK